MRDRCPICGRPPGVGKGRCWSYSRKLHHAGVGLGRPPRTRIDCERAGRLRAEATIDAMTAEVAQWAEAGFIDLGDDDTTPESFYRLARAWAKSKEPKP